MKPVKILWGLWLCVPLLVGLAGCSPDQTRTELGRQISPNQRLVAVLTETLTGGTPGSVVEDLYLGDQGTPFNLENPVFTASGCSSGLSIAWRNDYTVEIHYPSTCAISAFTNRWYRPSDLQVGRPNPIEIILVRA